MKILISGVSGFLGSHLFDLLSQNFDVYGISRNIASACGKMLVPDSIDFMPDVVVLCHAAVSSGNTALDTEELYIGNVEYTEKLAKRFLTSRFIYISSVSVYYNLGTITENSQISPKTEYAISKLWGEKVIQKIANRFSIIRLTSLFGTGMKENTLIPNYIDQALKSGAIEVWGNGERKQNYIHISDAALLIEKIIQNDLFTNKIYLGVNSKEYSNIEIATNVAGYLSAQIKFVNEDKSLSVKYDSSFTRRELKIDVEKNISDEIIKYIEWKKK